MKIYTAIDIIELDKEGEAGEYVSLADTQELRRLLERWNEIAPNLISHYSPVHIKLTQLTQDTNEALK